MGQKEERCSPHFPPNPKSMAFTARGEDLKGSSLGLTFMGTCLLSSEPCALSWALLHSTLGEALLLLRWVV